MKTLIVMPDNVVRSQFLPPEVISMLEEAGPVQINPSTGNYSEEALKEALRDADAAILGWGCPRITGKLLEGSSLKLIAHTGGTIAPYVDGEVFAKGVRVVCCNEIYARSVAEGTLAYMLAGLRKIPYYDQLLKNGGWRGDQFQNAGLIGKKVGLVGYGAITRWLIPMLKVFDVEILLNSGHISDEECASLGVNKASVTEIFAQCDIVSLHNALTDRTRGMVGRELLSLLKPGALLVNTARAGIIDETALLETLRENRFCAVLDVFHQEPLSVDAELRRMPNAILIPHMGGPTSDLYPFCGETVAEEIRRMRQGEPLRYEVSPEALGYMTAKG